MNKKILSFSLVSLVGVIGLGVAFGTSTNSFSLVNATNVNNKYGDEPGTTKRIYILIDDTLSWWFNGQTDRGDMLIHYWGDGITGTDWNNRPALNYIGTSNVADKGFEYGLYYYDVPAATQWMIIDYSIPSGVRNARTGDVQLTVGSEMQFFLLSDVAYSYAGYSQGVFINNSLTSEDLAKVLSHENIDTCSQSTASGYNCWNQINSIFINNNSYDYATPVDEGTEYESTIGDILNALEARSSAQTNQVD